MMMTIVMMMMLTIAIILMFLYSDEDTPQLSKWLWCLYLVRGKHILFSFFNS